MRPTWLKTILLLVSLWPALAAGADPPRLGLALSGGGAKGLAHIGVLKVLEEAGLNVDCISGVSMGAIIGSLYAIGYSPEELARITREQDWPALLSDRISRRQISIDEKSEEGRYVGSFPIRHFRVQLPSGLVAGQKLSALLSRLTLQVHHVEDFRTLPAPFVCVATDLESGEAVVLDHGFLPDALRASMSIPTVFTPMELEGRLLADGFLVRNLPAQDVRDLGADVVIGVDVGGPLYKKDELNSFVRVTEQVVNFRGAGAVRRQHRMCNVLIQPKLDDFSTLDFERSDSLIARGEQAARAMLPRLRELADSLTRLGGNQRRIHRLSPVERLYVTDLRFEGLHDVSRKLLLGRLQLRTPGVYSPQQVEQALERAYGTHFFERITYRTEPAEDGTRLVLQVLEKNEDQFRFGIHFDNDRKAAVLLNTTWRNVLSEGSRLILTSRLSENPAFEGSYFVQTGWRPSISVGAQLNFTKLDVITYTAAGNPEANYDYEMLRADLVAQTIFSNSFALGGILRYQNSMIHSVFTPEQYSDWQYGLVNLLGFVRFDNLDRTEYPHSGARIYAEAKLVSDPLSSFHLKGKKPFMTYTLSLERAIPVGRRLTLPVALYAGWVDTDNLPNDYLFFIGGNYPVFENTFPFMGTRFMERVATSALVLQVGAQYEFSSGKYVILRANAAKTRFDLEGAPSTSDLFGGVGLTLGLDSPIGPLEYSLMYGEQHRNFLTNINIGYRF